MSGGEVTAAGGIVWRRAPDGGIELLLVHRPKYDDWSLPKGKHDPGETDEECARREIEEETGLVGELGARVGTARYLDGKGRDKVVHYFEVREPAGEFVPNDEVDEVRWLAPEPAAELLTYPHDAELVAGFSPAPAPEPDGPAAPVVDEPAPALAVPTAGARLTTYRPAVNDPADWFSADELARARAYQRPLARLRIVRGALSAAVLFVFVFADVGPRLLDALDVTNWVAQLVVMVVALELVSLAFNPALDAWVDLRHDKEWGLSTQTPKGFVGDQLKSLLLGLVMNTVLLVPLFWVIRTTDLWWVYGWALVLVFSIGLGFLFPIVIAPIFNKFTPLEDGELSTRIGHVARLAGVDISGAYVADESRRSRRDNAYVAGLGATRRVVLFDTLLEHPPAVVEQVVAHEIGHWRLHHLRRQIPLAAALSFVVFALLKLLSEWTWLFDQAGITTSGTVPLIGQPAALPILLFGVQAGFAVTGLVSGWVSRAFERQADLEALELLQQPQVMLDMQRRLHVKNLADLDPSLLRRLQATHPPAAERMAFTRAWAEANGVVVERPDDPEPVLSPS
ncbi:MAG: M48 family metalloprotease [Acidimicrobiales bacterium]|nr:M48 family metalloprotease [Acidimicrobiales bacterium]